MKKIVCILLIIVMGMSQQKEIDMAQQKESGYVAPKAVYKPTPAPKYVNRKQKDEDYIPPAPTVPAWLGGTGLSNATAGVSSSFAPSQPDWYKNEYAAYMGGPYSPSDISNPNVPVQALGLDATPQAVGQQIASQGQALQRANVMQRTANRDDVAPTPGLVNAGIRGPREGYQGIDPFAPTPGLVNAGIRGPREGYQGIDPTVLAQNVLDLLKPQPGLVNGGIRGPRGPYQQEPDLGWWNNLFPPDTPPRTTQYAPRENVGNLPAPRAMASQHAPRENISNYYQYLASLEPQVQDPYYGFGTSYGGNWGGGGGGGYGGGGYSSPGWLDPRYLNLYDWKWRS